MSGWQTHEGVAVALDHERVDTDQLIPARFMSTPRADGYGRFLLYDHRHDADGAARADFILHRVPDASVLIARRNFGVGSSREAAVYALVDFGIRAIIAPSFGDIFASNAVNNGLLPATVGADVVDRLIATLGDGGAEARVDLAASAVTIGSTTAGFSLDPVWREKLINGWDDIDLSRQHGAAVEAFRNQLATAEPWAVLRGGPDGKG